MSRTYVKSVPILPPIAATTALEGTSAVVNLAELPAGDVFVEFTARRPDAESGFTAAAKWMEADAEEGPFADSGLLFSDVEELADVEGEPTGVHNLIPLDRTVRKQFGRLVVTPTGVDPAILVAGAVLAYERYEA